MTDSQPRLPLRTAYRALLLAVSAIYGAVAALAVTAPLGVIAALHVCLSALVILEVTMKPGWGRIATKLFSVLLVVSGAAMWASALVGGSLPQSDVEVIRRTLNIVLGAFFLKYINVGMPLVEYARADEHAASNPKTGDS